MSVVAPTVGQEKLFRPLSLWIWFLLKSSFTQSSFHSLWMYSQFLLLMWSFGFTYFSLKDQIYQIYGKLCFIYSYISEIDLHYLFLDFLLDGTKKLRALNVYGELCVKRFHWRIKLFRWFAVATLLLCQKKQQREVLVHSQNKALTWNDGWELLLQVLNSGDNWFLFSVIECSLCVLVLMWVFNYCHGWKLNPRLQLPEPHEELFLCNEMSFKGKGCRKWLFFGFCFELSLSSSAFGNT